MIIIGNIHKNYEKINQIFIVTRIKPTEIEDIILNELSKYININFIKSRSKYSHNILTKILIKMAYYKFILLGIKGENHF